MVINPSNRRIYWRAMLFGVAAVFAVVSSLSARQNMPSGEVIKVAGPLHAESDKVSSPV
ncbi:MAG: hypothetical protein WA705_13110 [Candidatus Ozemobacteraceae bacterium]